MILSAQSIRNACIINPFYERTIENGMSYGLGPNGYDVRIAQDVVMPGRGIALASTIERFDMPDSIMARVTDKSTWARRFVSVFNTTIDAGWCGFLTLELVNHSDEVVRISTGTPIAKIIFERLDEPTEHSYNGVYQNQLAGAQPAMQQLELPMRSRLDVLHAIRQEHDEYACMCGMRWDIIEGEEHP